uniref:Major facilitator superfamily (MFS) profile domain-containing protein n=1 Tax=Romanomermis culicivorax TaxID=13658 RepID=A0A915KIC8_ROMCU
PPLQSWNKHITGLVVSATFYGSLVFQLPGGLIANKISAKSIFGWAVCLNAVLNLLMPVACVLHYTAAIAIQFGQGLMFGITYPALFKLWKHWAPPLEKTRLVTSAMCGSYIGVVLGMPLSATLTKYVGWEAPFYLYGGLGIVWFLFWSLFTADTPRLDATISERELQYIENSIGDKAMENPVKMSEIPWKSIAKSKPFWAIVVASFCRNWTLYVYVIFSLSFLKESFHMDIEHVFFKVTNGQPGTLEAHISIKNQDKKFKIASIDRSRQDL